MQKVWVALRNHAAGVVVCIGVSALAQQAPAAVLLPNTEVAVPSQPWGGAVVVATPGDGPTFSAPTFSGSLDSAVVQETLLDNPLGGLSFAYRIENNPDNGLPPAETAIKRLSLLGFGGFSTDVLQEPDPTNAPPATSPAATADRDSTGTVVSFNFKVPDPIDPGQSSTVVIVRTDATSYTFGEAFILNGGAVTVGAYVPVPEPAALSLLGVAGLALLRRR